MKKKETEKILNSLMGFYQVACSLYDGLQNVKDEVIKAIVFKEHFLRLVIHQKEFTDKHNILIPKLDDMYRNYCAEFTDKIIANDSAIKEVAEKYKKSTNIGYII